MAHLADISVGNYTNIFYDNGTAWEQITEVQSIPAPTDEASVVAVQQYGQLYQRQLVGSRSVGNIDLIVNWNPTNQTHTALEGLYDSSEVTRFYIEYTDAAGTDATYQEFEAIVGSKSLASDFDSVRGITFSLVVADGLGNFTDTEPVYA